MTQDTRVLDEVVELRIRTANMLMTAAAGTWLVFFTAHLLSAHPMMSLICAVVALVTTGIALWSRRGSKRRYRISAHFAAGVSALGLVVIAMISGQSQSAAWWYLPLVPLFVATIVGVRAGLGWGIVVVLLIMGVMGSEVWFPIQPEGIEGLFERSMGGITVAIFTMGFTLRSNRNTNDALIRIATQSLHLAEQTQRMEEQQKELQDARDAANQASNFKTAFIADMSHELRTPINGVLGMAAMLADTDLRSDQREMIQALRSAGGALKQILDDILDVSKTEAGRLELEREPFSLRDCVVESVDVFGALAAQKGIELVALINPHLPSYVIGDSVRLAQVVRNLVGNAVKFTESGEVVISLGFEDGRTAILEVRDTGPGIEEEVREQLFKRFHSHEMPFGTRHVGTGLGLWLCRKLISLMGGNIEVKSTPQIGSTFRATFPLEVDNSDDTLRSSIALLNVNILAIEGHPIAREAMRLCAAGLGARVTVVNDVDAALEQCRSTSDPWDTVVVSASALGQRVETLVAELRAASNSPNLPVVLAASPAAVARAHDLQQAGDFAGVTLKPIVAIRFAPVLEHALFMRSLAPSVRDQVERPRAEGYGLRALVVEDDEVSRRVAHMFLKRLGCTVDVADGGRAGLDAVRRSRYDLVFLDLVMPDISGIEIAEVITKELPSERRPMIVALTGSVFESDRHRARAAGMDDFLSKPIEVSTLHAVLERAKMRVARRDHKAVSEKAQSTSPAVEDVLDRKKLEELEALFDDHDLVLSLLDDFVEENGRDAALVREHMEAGDWGSIRRIAHSLKSRAGAMGAIRLAEVATMLEKRSARGSADELGGEMCDEIEFVRGAIMAVRNEKSA